MPCLDLAWTATKESGICRLEGTSPNDLRCARVGAMARSVEELVEDVAEIAGTVVVAIDAPLLYTPERWAEREIGRVRAVPFCTNRMMGVAKWEPSARPITLTDRQDG